jgi:glycosyltransferase involved in cell wall biosynthesis
MRILQVIPYFNPKFGGDVNSTYLVSKKLSDRGHEVTVLTTDFQFDSSYAQQLENIDVIPIECSFNLGLFLFSPKMKVWLSENLLKFDIIHMQNYRSYQNAVVSNYAQKFKIPYILQARGTIPAHFDKQNLKKLFDFIWGATILRNAQKFIASTEEEQKQYKSLGIPGEKITIIPNGIDLTLFAVLPQKGMFKLKYGIAKEEKLVLFLGRIHKIKGIDLLIEAFSNVQEVIPDVTLVIAGPDDGYKKDVQKVIEVFNISNKVLFTGPLYGQDKLSAYVDADVYVLPSIHESFSNTILEAWACSTPVILTETCALSTIAQHAGIVIKRTPIELSKAIKRIIVDEVLRKKNIEQGNLLVNTTFNLEIIINGIEDCYRKIIENRF